MPHPEEPPPRSAPFKRVFTYPLIRHCDMPAALQKDAIAVVSGACHTHPDNNQSAAQLIKETFDAKYGGSWHAIVGEQFGFELSHEPRTLLYMFFGGSLAICIWKCA